MTLTQIIAANVTQLRAEKKLTQKQVGQAAGISISMVSMLERGVRTPSVPALEPLAAALGTTPPKLLEAP